MPARPFSLLLALTGALMLAGCAETVTDDTGAAVKDGGSRADGNRSP